MNSMRLQIREHFEDRMQKERLPHYVSWEDLRATSVEIIFGLLASPAEVPNTALYLGELLMWMFLHQTRSDYERCGGKKSSLQMWQLLQGLDDEKFTGQKAHAWIKSMIYPCTSMSALMDLVQTYTNDTNVAIMSVITAIVFPAGVRHLRSALTQKSDLHAHVPILLRSMEHMKLMDGRYYMTEVAATLIKYAEWIQHFKATKKRKGSIHLRSADQVWQDEIDEKPAKKHRSLAEGNMNEICTMIHAKRQVLVDLIHTLSTTCDDTGDEVCASDAKDAALDIHFAVDNLLSTAQVGRQQSV
jgi:hypothetical protein